MLINSIAVLAVVSDRLDFPTSGVDDAPLVSILVNPDWKEAILSALSRLETSYAWDESADYDDVEAQLLRLAFIVVNAGEVSPMTDLILYGDGSDGDVTISAGTTTLSRDMYYNNLTMSGTGILASNGYRVFVKGILDLSSAQAGAISRTGANGGNGLSTGTGGNAGNPQTAAVLGIGSNAGNGGAGGPVAGSAGTQGSTAMNGGATVSSGNAGAGSSGAGGTATVGGGLSALALPIRRVAVDCFLRGTAQITGGLGGPGGGGGGGDGSAGGGGGGGGTGGSVMALYCKTLKTGGSTPAGAISVAGGNGGNGGSPSATNRGGGGGGSGGGGGWLYLVCGERDGSPVTDLLNASGGNGGNGGNGSGTGIGGRGGGAGGGGRITTFSIDADTTSELVPTVGALGAVASGASGGAGATGIAARVTF